MIEFKGTKGKWVISGTNRDYSGNTGYFLSSKVKISEVEANALLISKAPEMLEMLEKLSLIFKNFNPPTKEIAVGWANQIDNLIKEATEL